MATGTLDCEHLKGVWTQQQMELRHRLSLEDAPELRKALESTDDSKEMRVGGLDLSFFAGDDGKACVGYVILSVPLVEREEHLSDQQSSLTSCPFEVLYEDLCMTRLSLPYIPGFLAFRESEALLSIVRHQMRHCPHLTPDVILLDGNGRIHPMQFGLACHVGLALDLPAIGVAKNQFYLDADKKSLQVRQKEDVGRTSGLSPCRGDILDTVSHPLDPTELLGVAIKTSWKATKPVYVSVGHKISLDSAVKVVMLCCRTRIPEPIRQADLRSREAVRKCKV